MLRYSILFTIFIVLIVGNGIGGILKSIECSELYLNNDDDDHDHQQQIDNLLTEMVDDSQQQQQQQNQQQPQQLNELLDSSMADDRNNRRHRPSTQKQRIQLTHQSGFSDNQNYRPEFIDGIDPIAQNDFYHYLANERQQQQQQRDQTNPMKTLEFLPQPMQKRGCLRRGENCEHRTNDCCYNSSCRCNLWGSNCRCQRIGLFQKWG